MEEVKPNEEAETAAAVDQMVESDDAKVDEPTAKNGDKKKKKKEKIPGVLYLSRIPTKMNVKIIREYLGIHGEVDRVYLEPAEKKRKNQRRSFIEGWVEFKDKKYAKLAAKRLNSQQVGGKKSNPWYHELWNIKYLKNFRWTHLNERKAYEKELRKQRLRQEISLAKKEANFYAQNFEKNEKRKKFEKKAGDASNETSEQKDDSKTEKKTANDDELPMRHKKFERKVKVAGNDDFLKQIFS